MDRNVRAGSSPAPGTKFNIMTEIQAHWATEVNVRAQTVTLLYKLEKQITDPASLKIIQDTLKEELELMKSAQKMLQESGAMDVLFEDM